MIDAELDTLKRQNFQALAAGLGYSRVPGETGTSYTLKNESGDKVIAKQDGDRWTYFSVHDRSDNGSVLDFVQQRIGGSLGHVRKWLREATNQEILSPTAQSVDLRAEPAQVDLKWTPLSRQLLVEFKVDPLRLLPSRWQIQSRPFFEPLHLDLQPPNLAVQRIQVGSILDPPPAPLALEQRLQPLLGLPFPGRHLMRMDFVGSRDLVDRLAAGQCFQRHLGLQLRTEHFPLHYASPRYRAVYPCRGYLIYLSEIWGPL